MVLPETISAGVTTGHNAHHIELHDWKNADSTINVKTGDYGAVGDGVANDSAPLAAALLDCPPGGTLYVPNGLYLSDPLATDKAVTIRGDGRFSTWLKPRTAVTGPFLEFELPTSLPPGGIRGHYGSSMLGIGLDCYNSPSCTGLLAGSGSTWMVLRDFLVNGCANGIDMRGINSWIEDVFCGDNGRHIVVDNDTGGQLTIRDGYFARNTTGITTVAVDITNTATASGASIRIYNCQVASFADVNRHTAAGIRISAPTSQSAPVFATMNEIDNIYGGAAFESINCWDINLTSNWMNSTGPCVQITGGKRIKAIGNEMFGAPGFKFLDPGAGLNTEWFTSGLNTIYSGPAYWLPAANKPIHMKIDDHCINASADSHITNDMPGLLAACSQYDTTVRKVIVDQSFREKINRRESGTNPPTGTATLVGGVKTINHTKVTALTRVKCGILVPGGTVGTVYSNTLNNVPGVSFQLNSTSVADTSLLWWEMWEGE